MTINELSTLNKNYYISNCGSKGEHIKHFYIGEKQLQYRFCVLVVDDCIQCIFDYRKLLFIAEGFKDKDNLRVKCGKNRVCTRYINLFIFNYYS